LLLATAQALSARIGRGARPAILAIAVMHFMWFLAVARSVNLGLLTLLGLLASAWWAVTRLGGTDVPRWARLGLSVLAGWMTVATVVSTAYVLRDGGWAGWGLWALVMLPVTGFVALVLRLRLVAASSQPPRSGPSWASRFTPARWC
jgi:hypothetical protein